GALGPGLPLDRPSAWAGTRSRGAQAAGCDSPGLAPRPLRAHRFLPGNPAALRTVPALRRAARARRPTGAAGDALPRCLEPGGCLRRSHDVSARLAAPVHRATIPEAATDLLQSPGTP